MNQKQIGIFISYLNLAIGMVINIFLTPYLISALGDVDYSLYKVMQSFAGPLAMFHLGISTIVTRSIVQNKNDKAYTKKDKQNTMALALLASFVMSVVVFAAGIIMNSFIPEMYGLTYTDESVRLGQKIFLIFVSSTILHMMTDAFSGCLIGHEKFAVSSSLQLCKNILKIILWVVFLEMGMGVFWVACVDFIISAVTFLATAGYAVFVLQELPKLYCLDTGKLFEIISFGSAILLQAVVNQVNNNVDTMILGAYVDDKAIITMYSSALAIYAIYNSLISVIANFFLPKATELVTKNATGEEITDFVIGPGRFQAVLAVACILGFALFGKNFISIWIGEQYMDAYFVTLMLMIPVTIPLVENTMISVLDASLKRIYRSVILVVMAVINVIASIILIKEFGFWGAAIGTVASLLIGHGVLMNSYYAKTFGLQVGRMFCSIFKGILPAGIATAFLCLPLAIFLPDTLVFFAVKCICFVLIYMVLLFGFGLNDSEKLTVEKILKKLRKS